MAGLRIEDYVDVDSIDGTELMLVSKSGDYRKTTIEEIRNLASDIANTELADLVGKIASAQDVKNILNNISSNFENVNTQLLEIANTNKSTYFTANVDFNSQYFRIPFCEITNNGVIIAGSDIRYNGSADLEKIDIGIARSLDGGKTWQDKQIVLQNNNLVTYSRKMDATILVNRNTNRVFLFAHCIDSNIAWETCTDPSTITTHFVYKYSDDDGLTWSQEYNLDSLKPSTCVTMFGGVGKGITMSDGTIVVPVQLKSNNTTIPIQSSIIASTDNGATWTLKTLLPVYTSECQVVEYATGKLMINARGYIGYRRIYTSSDKGTTWVEDITDANTLIEPSACQGSFDTIVLDENIFGLFANPNSSSARQNITIQATANFVDWKKVYTVIQGNADGYTCLANHNGQIIIAVERSGSIELHNVTNLKSHIQSNDMYSPIEITISDSNYNSADGSISISPSAKVINVAFATSGVIVSKIKNGKAGQTIIMNKDGLQFYIETQSSGGANSIIGHTTSTNDNTSTNKTQNDYITGFTNKPIQLTCQNDGRWLITSPVIYSKNEQIVYIDSDGYISLTPGMTHIYIDVAKSQTTTLNGFKGAYQGQEIYVTILSSTTPITLAFTRNVSDYTTDTSIVSTSDYNLYMPPDNTGLLKYYNYLSTINCSEQKLHVKIARGVAIILNIKDFMLRSKITTQTGYYNMAMSDSYVFANAVSAQFSVLLPDPSNIGIQGLIYTIKKIDSTSNAVMVKNQGSGTIDGKTELDITTPYQAMRFITDGSNWYSV